MSALRGWWQRSPIGEYYRAQTQRDQLVLIAVAAMAVLALYVVALWRPVSDWRAQNEARYERQAELLAYMRTNERRLQPEGEGSITVVMDDEEFDRIVRFVDVIEREHGLALRQVTIDRKAPGRASARLVIR